MIINYLFEFDEMGNVSKYIGTDPENVFPIRCRKVGSDNPFDNDFTKLKKQESPKIQKLSVTVHLQTV